MPAPPKAGAHVKRQAEALLPPPSLPKFVGKPMRSFVGLQVRWSSTPAQLRAEQPMFLFWELPGQRGVLFSLPRVLFPDMALLLCSSSSYKPSAWPQYANAAVKLHFTLFPYSWVQDFSSVKFLALAMLLFSCL